MSKENENIENSVGITVTFESLISEYAGTAMAYLGGMQDPETKKVKWSYDLDPYDMS